MMSGNDTLRKGKRVLQASSFDEWRRAPWPNYVTNQDLKFPYSEYPRNQPYEYYSVQLPPQNSKQILDFWGEGRLEVDGLITGFREAYNVNHQFQLVSNGADSGKKIPNRIPTINYQEVSVEKYVPDSTFDIITLMGAPIYDSTAVEIARIISGYSNSLVVAYGFSESDEGINNLKSELDAKQLLILADYILPSPLNEITINEHVAFLPLDSVVSKARSYFLSGQMPSCANILCSLQRSSDIQDSARKALRSFFSYVNVKDNYTIFALGYELDTTSDGREVMNQYMNKNVVKIVRSNYTYLQIQSSYGKAAYLCPYDKVGSGSWQWGFFGSSGYKNDGDHLALERSTNNKRPTEFKIKADYGYSSYLCAKSVGSGSYQYAFFGTASYNNKYYDGGQYFRLYPVSGGEKFKVQANFGETSYLCVSNVSSWQYAFFGTSAYINGGYSAGETLKIIFH